MTALARLGECGLIERLTRGLRYDRTVFTGVGDDAAVLCGGKDWRLLLTTDMLVDGTHFRSRETAPALIGRKALAVCLSDIAAMGGWPWAAVVAVGVPPRTPVAMLESLYHGMRRLAARYRVQLVGGDTVRAPRLTLAIALTGWSSPRTTILRAGARPGDRVFVTGRLGGSLRSGRHVRFEPRVREAQALLRLARPTAMMDLSDGLASDLRQLARASDVGFRIEAAQIPKAPGVRTVAAALCDGEDFELVFTINARQAKPLEGRRVLGVPLTCIGEVTRAREGLALVDARGRTRALPRPRFRHF